MRGALQRFFPATSGSAGSRINRAKSVKTAQDDDKLPQSQPMQRSVTNHPINLSPSDSVCESDITSYSPSPLQNYMPEGLRSPLKSSDPTLLRVAEILTESVRLEDDTFFTPSPDEPELVNYDYSEMEATVLAVHSLLKQAQLPVPTFLLAALILRRLRPSFYIKWAECLSAYGRMHDEEVENTKELVIISAIIIAQKFLHDAIYTLTTWSTLVCGYRPDLHKDLFHITERLIVDHVKWRISAIADEDIISKLTTLAFEESDHARLRYNKYIPSECFSDESDDGEYSPRGEF